MRQPAVSAAGQDGKHESTEPGALAAFWQGYLALLPLWTGAIPAGVAYGVAARGAGLSVFETQLMSLTVFSAAAQIGAVSLLGAGGSALLLVGTVLALNAQLLLLGLAVGRQLRLSWPQRLLTACIRGEPGRRAAPAGRAGGGRRQHVQRLEHWDGPRRVARGGAP
jgi:hypothetical protein